MSERNDDNLMPKLLVFFIAVVSVLIFVREILKNEQIKKELDSDDTKSDPVTSNWGEPFIPGIDVNIPVHGDSCGVYTFNAPGKDMVYIPQIENFSSIVESFSPSSDIFCYNQDQLALKYMSRKCMNENGCVDDRGSSYKFGEIDSLWTPCVKKCDSFLTSVVVGPPGKNPFSDSFLAIESRPNNDQFHDLVWGDVDMRNKNTYFSAQRLDVEASGEYTPAGNKGGKMIRFTHNRIDSFGDYYIIRAYRDSENKFILDVEDITEGDRLVLVRGSADEGLTFTMLPSSTFVENGEKRKTFSTISIDKLRRPFRSILNYNPDERLQLMIDGDSAEKGKSVFIKNQRLLRDSGRMMSHQILQHDILDRFRDEDFHEDSDVNVPFYFWPGTF